MSTAALSALEACHATLRHALMAGDAAAITEAAASVAATVARIGDDDWSVEPRHLMFERISRLRAEFTASRGLLNAFGDHLACRETVVAALRGDGMATQAHC